MLVDQRKKYRSCEFSSSVEQVSMSTYLCVIMATRLGYTVMRRTFEFGGPRGLCMGDGREERPGRFTGRRSRASRSICGRSRSQENSRSNFRISSRFGSARRCCARPLIPRRRLRPAPTLLPAACLRPPIEGCLRTAFLPAIGGLSGRRS